MKRIVLIGGAISGGILALTLAVSMVLYTRGLFRFDHAAVVGYSSMVLAFVIVFIGIRTYRQGPGGGAISFGKAFQVGILITLIASFMYVATWEVLYYNFVPDFLQKCDAYTVQKLRASGASEAELQAKQQEMAKLERLYANPLVNVGMTFLEVFPVGLLVTLISAAILRKRGEGDGLAPATAAA
jgi:hypothetical protein